MHAEKSQNLLVACNRAHGNNLCENEKSWNIALPIQWTMPFCGSVFYANGFYFVWIHLFSRGLIPTSLWIGILTLSTWNVTTNIPFQYCKCTGKKKKKLQHMNPMYNLSDLCFFLWMFVSGKKLTMLPKEGKHRKLLLALQSCHILDLWLMTAFSEKDISSVPYCWARSRSFQCCFSVLMGFRNICVCIRVSLCAAWPRWSSVMWITEDVWVITKVLVFSQ